MFGLGTQELLIILFIAFLLFGAKRLPEIGAGLGKGIRSFKEALREAEVKEGVEKLETPAEEARAQSA
ncbi:MAG: twin-arginine translocase TatA/TatE family subunit [Thermodesulfatator sp.]|nr:MAG: twin-arginine translocase TatA/TatE family subunit [Thermodesulfatator sp.]